MIKPDKNFSFASWGAFENWKALIVHRPHPNVEALLHQLKRIGIEAVDCWPELPHQPDMSAFDIVFFDVDMGYDGQFPWDAQLAPMPTIALIGSEAPGRISWAMTQGADAQLVKPIGSAGVYSALVIASHNFRRRHALSAEINGLRDSLLGREALAQATALLMIADNSSAKDAYQKLRLDAMAERISIEEAARRIIASVEETGNNRERA